MAKNIQTEQANKPDVPYLNQMTVEPAEFDNIISTATKKSEEIEKLISSMFKGAFDDYKGCKIEQISGQLKCKLYFEPTMNKTEDGVYAVKAKGEISKKKTGGFSDFVNTVNMINTSKQYDLTEEAKELLAEFVVAQDVKIVDRFNPLLNKTVKVRLPKNWNTLTNEVADSIQYSRFQQPYLVVYADLTLLVAKIWGKKDAKELKSMEGIGIPKDRYQYSVNVIRVLDLTLPSYILEVRRIDIKELNKLAQSIGYGNVSSGSIVMTR